MNLHSESTDRLFKAILRLESLDDCYKFFEDLCTIKELQDMAQRLDAAVLLYEGVSYQNIAKQVNISSATICRVNKCLIYGDGGYRAAIEKMKQEETPKNESADTGNK